MAGSNGCRECFLDWNLCQCVRELDAGELAITARVKAGEDVYRTEYRNWVEEHRQCQAPGNIGGGCMIANTNRPCTAICRYYVAE